jgi:hypothetical protein
MEFFKKNVSQVRFSPITFNTKTVGWDAYFFDYEKNLISGGTHSDKNIALRIGYAEFIERELVKKIAKDCELAEKFRIQDFPTSCGFSAGFSKKETEVRALLEAIERWSWSKWIDEKILLKKFSIYRFTCNDLTKSLLLPFSKVELHFQEIDCSDLKMLKPPGKIMFGALLCYTKNGVFLGSRVSNSLTDILRHSAVEANRAYKIHRDLSPEEFNRKNNFFYSRLNFFASNQDFMPRLDEFKKIAFPIPKISLFENLNLNVSNTFLTRVLIKDFIPWHIGDEKRFIY